MIARTPLALALSLALVACAGDTGPGNATVDSAVGNDATLGGDASDGVRRLPTWRLEDVQPASPRVGQTYGVDTFTNRVIVVSLLEGF
ncbi:MAG: hypothetical protein KBG48_11160 [Kofleriaceae bacterium]|nr:hypothetical protein [Kofleriaceae bacterium]MBP9167942.1 hypothetical protein [Kofleriaceae bacterium]MBP9856776.1 hypothetical protein [Kofleriaceae bacterium]